MDDVTPVMDGYRECIRHIWNAYFAADARADTDWVAVEDYHVASAHLFHALVLRKLGHEAPGASPVEETRQDPLSFLRLELDPNGEIYINRERSSGYWDYPLNNVFKGELDLAFLGFFDWSQTDHRDFSFYRVRIIGSTKYPAVVGKDALVPIGPHVRVMSEAAQQGDEADEA